jgi:CheY-like chemotaxis protein
MQASLKIVIVDENPTRAAVMQDALREAGSANLRGRGNDKAGQIAEQRQS